MTTHVLIASLAVASAQAAAALTAAVGWSHRREDWQLALSVGHGVGAFTADGALRGVLVWFAYGPLHAHIGMVAVDPSLHRSGIGRVLMQRAMVEAGQRSLLLISTEAGRRLYETLGFRAIGSNAAHTGTPVPAEPVDGVDGAQPDELEALAALDAAALGFSRKALVGALAAAGETAVIRSKGTISGFAVCRRFGTGHVVGPVVACTGADASRLIAYWLARRAGEVMRVDVPGEHPELAAWLNAQGLKRGGELPIMVRGDVPVPAGPQRRYALAGQAMG